MPRAVFQLLWDEIGAGRPVAAYVKNRAKTGDYYWVMASVVPVDDGYLSVRVKPTSELFPVVRSLYEELRRLELSIEDGEGKARRRAIEAATELLGRRLQDYGYADYTGFMEVALATELAARERAPVVREALGDDSHFEAVEAATGRALVFLDDLFANLDRYAELNRDLGEQSACVGELASSIRLFSLNALLAATRFGDKGAALSAVADNMGRISVDVGDVLGSLTTTIGETVARLRRLALEISLCKLQAEMTIEFVHELRDDDGRHPEHQARVMRDVATLIRSVHRHSEVLIDSLGALGLGLNRIGAGSDDLARQLATLRSVQTCGKIEAATLDGAGHVAELFARIRQHIDDATKRTAEVVTLSRDAAQLTYDERALRADFAQLEQLAALAPAA